MLRWERRDMHAVTTTAPVIIIDGVSVSFAPRPAACPPPSAAQMTCRRAIVALPLLFTHPPAAWAHAFGERYDLPVPLGYFVIGAAATVALSFVVAALFMRRAPREFHTPRRAVIAAVPLAVLMVVFTTISLLVMAEPLVQFTQPGGLSRINGSGNPCAADHAGTKGDPHAKKRAQPS